MANTIFIYMFLKAIKSSDGGDKQEDQHDDDSDGQLGQESSIHLSHKLEKKYCVKLSIKMIPSSKEIISKLS